MRFLIKYDCGHNIEITDPNKFSLFFGFCREGKRQNEKLCDVCKKKKEKDER